MSVDVLARIDDALASHGDRLREADMAPAREWVMERFEEQREELQAADGFGWCPPGRNHVRPMLEVLHDFGSVDTYTYEANRDHDPLATWAEGAERPTRLDYWSTQLPISIRFDFDASGFIAAAERMSRTFDVMAAAVQWRSFAPLTPYVRELEPPSDTVEQVARTAGDFAVVDVGRAFTWPPPDRGTDPELHAPAINVATPATWPSARPLGRERR